MKKKLLWLLATVGMSLLLVGCESEEEKSRKLEATKLVILRGIEVVMDGIKILDKDFYELAEKVEAGKATDTEKVKFERRLQLFEKISRESRVSLMFAEKHREDLGEKEFSELENMINKLEQKHLRSHRKTAEWVRKARKDITTKTKK